MSAPQVVARVQWIVLVVAAAMLIMALAIGAASGQSAATAPALGASFTYQGQLNAGGLPANGPYDFQFRLFTAASDGSQVGPLVEVGDVAVSSGAFAVALDFGAVFDGSLAGLQSPCARALRRQRIHHCPPARR